MTLKSMTAYGSAKISTSSGTFIIEINSINRKIFDLVMHLPKELISMEMELRKTLSKEIKRGQITFRITKEMQAIENFVPETSLLKELKKKWIALVKELNFSKEEITLKFLVEQLTRFPLMDTALYETSFKKKLMKGAQEALDHLLKMKNVEGEFLEKDIQSRMKKIKQIVEQIKKHAALLPEQYKEKLLKRVQEFMVLGSEDKERLHREAIIYAEKSDITEEITRLFSHFEQFFQYVKSDEPGVGKTLDFLLQEMFREVNTITSKSTELKISKAALTIKSELEKIREQIQNIE